MNYTSPGPFHSNGYTELNSNSKFKCRFKRRLLLSLQPFIFGAAARLLCNGNHERLQHLILHPHQNPIRKIQEIPSPVPQLRLQLPIRGLQPSTIGRSCLRREATYPRDRRPRWSIRRQELSSWSTSWISLQCSRGRDGHTKASHPSDGAWFDSIGAPVSVSGSDIFVSIRFRFKSMLCLLS